MKGSQGHGPYWYGYWRETDSKGRSKVRSKYFGKRKPPGGTTGASGSAKGRAPSRWDIPSRWSQADACRVLGIKRPREAKAAWRKLIKRYHPDKSGGDLERTKAINGAWQYLRRR